jgi:hypothetical protein
MFRRPGRQSIFSRRQKSSSGEDPPSAENLHTYKDVDRVVEVVHQGSRGRWRG